MGNSKPRSGKSNSPFRYAGGKYYARNLINEQIPNNIENYCEPFAGGASIFFALKGKERDFNGHLNDLDENLMNTFTVIRDDVESLIDSLEGIEATKENHHYFKNEFSPKNDIERAKRWFYLNRTSYSGIMKIENCYWGYGPKYSMVPKNWPPHLRQVSDNLQGSRLSNTDFEKLIDELPDGTFCFVDPPYFNADQDKFYTCSFSYEDHIRLRDTLKRNSSRIHFLLTYDNTEELIELYSDWATAILDKEWNYTIARTDDQKNGIKLKDGHKGKRNKGKEVFIFNYEPLLILQDSSEPDLEEAESLF
jgi:DNA adenine methylase